MDNSHSEVWQITCSLIVGTQVVRMWGGWNWPRIAYNGGFWYWRGGAFVCCHPKV